MRKKNGAMKPIMLGGDYKHITHALLSLVASHQPQLEKVLDLGNISRCGMQPSNFSRLRSFRCLKTTASRMLGLPGALRFPYLF